MEGLPEELLIEVFSYFSLISLHTTIVQVCARWKEIIEQTARLSARFTIKTERDLDFLNAFKGSYHIRALEIRKEIDLINSLFEQLEGQCPYITHLTIHDCNSLSERHLHRLNVCFRHLKHIDVFLTSEFITKKFIDILPKMKSIVLNNKIDQTTLKLITLQCKQLTELHMYGFVCFYPVVQLHGLLEARLDRLSDLTLRCWELTDKTCEIIGRCIGLRSLRLYHCWLFTATGISHLLPLQYLKTFHLTGLKLVSKASFGNFISFLGMKYLTDLNFSSSPFNDDHALLLCNRTPCIKVLELWNCRDLTTLGVLLIVQRLKMLFILDLNMKLLSDVVDKVERETNIGYLTYFKPDCQAENRSGKLVVIRAFSYFKDLCFKGNGEGFRANLLCYSYFNRIPEIFNEIQQGNSKGVKRKFSILEQFWDT